VSTAVLCCPGYGALSGTIVGTATAPAVISTTENLKLKKRPDLKFKIDNDYIIISNNSCLAFRSTSLQHRGTRKALQGII